MSQELQRGVTGAESQLDYEDDFEKDLDWLIEEEARSEDQVSRLEMLMLTNGLKAIPC